MGAVNDVAGEIQFLVDAMVSDLVRKMSAEATSRTAGQVVALLEAFEQGIGVDDRADVWRDLARDAQDSAARSYIQSRTRGGPRGYRQQARNPMNVRYAGGRLLAALRSPEFVVVQGDSLQYGNTRVLDDQARQWRRLNFGAYGSAGPGPGPAKFDVKWGNMVVASIGLEPDPRPGFSIPAGTGRRGYWTSGGEFHPASEGPVAEGGGDGSYRWIKKKQTKGIVARNFLDAGVRRIAKEMPDAFREMYVRSWRNAETRVRMQSAGIRTVKPTRPPGSSVVRRRS